MCSSLKNISKYAHVGNTAYRLMRKNLPGPYTLVLPGSKLVPKIMLTKQKTVGIRVPDNPICLAIIEELGNPGVTSLLPWDIYQCMRLKLWDVEEQKLVSYRFARRQRRAAGHA